MERNFSVRSALDCRLWCNLAGESFHGELRPLDTISSLRSCWPSDCFSPNLYRAANPANGTWADEYPPGIDFKGKEVRVTSASSTGWKRCAMRFDFYLHCPMGNIRSACIDRVFPCTAIMRTGDILSRLTMFPPRLSDGCATT